MKYIHDYKDGSYCESEAFKSIANNTLFSDEWYVLTDLQYKLLEEGYVSTVKEANEIMISDEDYDKLSTGEYTLTNGIVTKKE